MEFEQNFNNRIGTQPPVETLGAGRRLTDIKNRIGQLSSDIEAMGPAPDELPGMIGVSNALRRNEYLLRVDSTKTELISIYKEYTKGLEELLKSVLELQTGLTEVLHEQSKLIPDKQAESPKKTSRRKPTRPVSNRRNTTRAKRR